MKFEQKQKTNAKFKLISTSIEPKKKIFSVTFSDMFTQLLFTESLIDTIKNNISECLGSDFKHYKIMLFAKGENLENLVPNFYRNHIDRDYARLSKINRSATPFVRNLDKPYRIREGLLNRNIAVWSSHGLHYEQNFNRWEWQRARLLQTVEDKFTAQIMYNFLLPMLENAGANVFLPRERDNNPNEIVVDNDTSWNNSIYRESGEKEYFTAKKTIGFAAKKKNYTDSENPFVDGTCRVLVSDNEPSASVEWIPNIHQSGYYWVSVSYQFHEKGSEDAKYQVFHTGGKTIFTVNQKQGAGTWIYLGKFYFEKGTNSAIGKVVLTNESRHKNHFITADAVRFGGGMGNIARKPADQATIDAIPDEKMRKNAKLLSNYPVPNCITSHTARFWEGARYWLQWAGIPFSIYSHTSGINDYTDDYASRGKWVNYLNYGSANAPDSVGLKIPIDLSFALHSDAGLCNNGIIGTLGIVTTKNGDKINFLNNQSRKASLDMANLIQSAVVEDIRRIYNPNWTSRGIMDKSYAESRFPEVPSMILEFLSHQNLNDMKLGHDPSAQFTIARSIYKGILKFITSQNNTDFTVQPLPINSFSAILDRDRVKLSWSQTIDTLEECAEAHGYVLYTRINGRGFNNGIYTEDTFLILPVIEDSIVSYKVTAVNAGGESFPSEILSVCKKSNSKGNILIVNGFTKVSAPESLDTDSIKGFVDWLDFGVPYLQDFSYTGKQFDFNIQNVWTNNDSPGFGASYGNFDTVTVAGNSFDYPYIHGVSIAAAGYSFCSTSVLAIENDYIQLSDFQIIDVILGKQKSYNLGNKIEFKTFSSLFQQKVTDFLKKGKTIFISGAYVGSDLWRNGSESDQNFAKNILKYSFRTAHASTNGAIEGVYSPIVNFRGDFDFAVTPNSTQYHVESPDGIEPDNKNACTVIRYGENKLSAAVAYKGSYSTFVCGFPFEAITNKTQRDGFMKQVLEFFRNEK
jgi:hypothetical protein